MSRLDDIERRINARMEEIERRISGRKKPLVAENVARVVPVMTSAVAGLRHEADDADMKLTEADLSAVSTLEFRLVGLRPGDEVTQTGGRFQGDPNEEYDKIWSAVVATARQFNVILGVCRVLVDGRPVCIRIFDGPTVFCRGIPDKTDKINEAAIQVQRYVAMIAAYYLRRWRFSGLDDICTLWSFANAMVEGNTISRVSYASNALCINQGGSSAMLCFSPSFCDEVIAGHEFTHGVSQNKIGWVRYYGEIGAVNESFSDIFAKFSYWGWHGKEPNDPERWMFSASRDMAHPESRICNMSVPTGEVLPDGGVEYKQVPWRSASYYLQGMDRGNVRSEVRDGVVVQVYYGWYVGHDDNCGVHINNGVLTRLCFLLCDGERFVRDDGRRFDVAPLGYVRTERLFGQLMFGSGRYLPRACNMYSFCKGLILAAEDIGFSDEENDVLLSACDAVNIIPPEYRCKRGMVASMHRKLSSSATWSPDMSFDGLAGVFADEFSAELGLNTHGTGFSVVEEAVTIPPGLKGAVQTGGEVQIVLGQTWNGLPVYGSSAMVRVRDGDEVTYFENGFSSRLGSLEADTCVDAETACEEVLSSRPGQLVTSAEKIVYDPRLFGEHGRPCVAWLVKTESGGMPSEQCIVDAGSVTVVHSSPLHIVD